LDTRGGFSELERAGSDEFNPRYAAERLVEETADRRTPLLNASSYKGNNLQLFGTTAGILQQDRPKPRKEPI
jgi:hypothetical protein